MKSEINKIKEKINQWRASKKFKGEKLPDALREAVGKLLGRYSDSEVGKCLRLQKAQLNRCRHFRANTTGEPCFVSVPNPFTTVNTSMKPFVATERIGQAVQVELSNSSGGLMRLRIPQGSIAELNCILGNFLTANGGSR